MTTAELFLKVSAKDRRVVIATREGKPILWAEDVTTFHAIKRMRKFIDAAIVDPGWMKPAEEAV